MQNHRDKNQKRLNETTWCILEAFHRDICFQTLVNKSMVLVYIMKYIVFCQACGIWQELIFILHSR